MVDEVDVVDAVDVRSSAPASEQGPDWSDAAGRSLAIELAVRAALGVLTAGERTIVEGYYFDGRSLPQLARSTGVPLDFVRISHRRALAKLEVELAPFVERMFGLAAIRHVNCAICRASWRAIAEDILDGKTADTTWGQIAIRIERAVGWKAPSPQALITHQRKHRRFVKSATQQEEGELPCTHHITCADSTR
jgi:hypothetical protein